MRIIIILFYFIAICIVFSSFNRYLFDELLAHCLCSIFLLKKIFSYSKSQLFYFKHHCNKRFTFVITLEHILHIRQIMFKNLIIFTKRKSLSTHKITKIFSLFLILQNVFYFVFFVFAHKNYFCRENNICIYII